MQVRIGIGLGSGGVSEGDVTAPTVAITCAQTSPTAVSPLNFTFTLSEVSTDFVIDDITVGNGTASNFAGSGMVYTCDVTPTLFAVTVDVAAGAFHDAAGNPNLAAVQFSILYIDALVWLRGKVGTYLDSAKTQPATTLNDAVYVWADQSGHGRDYVQATAGNRPVVKPSTLNGKTTIYFDGNDFMTLASAVGYKTAIFVTKYASGLIFPTFAALLGVAGVGSVLFGGKNNTSLLWPSPGPVYHINGIATEDLAPITNYNIIEQSLVTTNTDYLCQSGTDTSRIWLGNLAEVILLSDTLTTAQRNAFGQYLSAEYGINFT